MPTHAAAHPAGTPRRPGRPGAPTLTPIIPVPDTPGRRSPVSGRRRQRGCRRPTSRSSSDDPTVAPKTMARRLSRARPP